MSDFNARNITGVIVDGGKSLYAQSAPSAQTLKFNDQLTVTGLRFKTRVEARTLTAFVPFTQIVGIYGEADGEPVGPSEPTITLDASGILGLYIVGGRLLRVRKAEAVSSPFGNALRVTILNDAGRDEELTVGVSQVTAILGDLRTDYEREADDLDRKAEEAEDFVRTYATDSKTYAAQMAKQTTYVKATKTTEIRCAACGEVFPPSQYIVPVYVAGVGIVHPDNVECQPFSKRGLIAHNAKVASHA